MTARIAITLAILAATAAGIAIPPRTYALAPAEMPTRWMLRVTYTIDVREYGDHRACLIAEDFININRDAVPDGATRDAMCEAVY